jgi:hypothetical protein
MFKKASAGKTKNSIKLNYLRETFKNPRWGYDKPPHKILYDIINERREDYKKVLNGFLDYKESFLNISKAQDKKKPDEPYLENPWLPVLDSFALYSFLAVYNPEKYIEVGSGNSTKFAGRSIKDHKLQTKIISLDPEPREEIDRLCDEVIRKHVEDVDVTFFDQLNHGDILFVDNSHRCFMNSDVTAIFLDILPRLKPGVIVEFHDIFLPNDYPPHWGKRYYSEQYLLAAYLLDRGSRFAILLPNAFISRDSSLKGILEPIFTDHRWGDKGFDGGSFWIVTR